MKKHLEALKEEAAQVGGLKPVEVPAKGKKKGKAAPKPAAKPAEAPPAPAVPELAPKLPTGPLGALQEDAEEEEEEEEEHGDGDSDVDVDEPEDINVSMIDTTRFGGAHAAALAAAELGSPSSQASEPMTEEERERLAVEAAFAEATMHMHSGPAVFASAAGGGSGAAAAPAAPAAKMIRYDAVEQFLLHETDQAPYLASIIREQANPDAGCFARCLAPRLSPQCAEERDQVCAVWRIRKSSCGSQSSPVVPNVPSSWGGGKGWAGIAQQTCPWSRGMPVRNARDRRFAALSPRSR